MHIALWALAVSAFGIGTTEFVIMGLLPTVSADLSVSLSQAGLLVSGYALGVFFGAPPMTMLTISLPRKQLLILLMFIFTIGNLACALAPNYLLLMVARIITSLAHGAFFGVGSVVATSLVSFDRKASAIALMFTGLTLANVLGVPFGTWLGLHWGWRSTFWVVTGIGLLAMFALILFLPRSSSASPANLQHELQVLWRPKVFINFLMTALGFAGVFTAYTYITPLLTNLAGISNDTVPLILVLFGIGLVIGNSLGGKLADKALVATLIGSLGFLTIVLALFSVTIHHPLSATVTVFLFGIAGFATVPALQMRVLQQAETAPNLASAFNVAAFNLGNALGAWVGGVTINSSLGLSATPVIGALVTGMGLVIAWFSRKMDEPSSAAK